MAHLAVPGPFDFSLTTERFRLRAGSRMNRGPSYAASASDAVGVDLATLWHEGGLHRVVDGREVRIEAAEGGVEVDPLDAVTEPVVRAVLGLVFDLDPFYAWAAEDEVLAAIVSRLAGFRPSLAPDPFEMLVGAITSQQVSLFSALAIRNRLIEAFGERAHEAWAFPTRERIAAAREEELVAVGFSRRKAEYVVSLAASDLDLDALRDLPDDDVRALLVAQRGIGEWTAEWFLARHLARPNAWPWGDLALRKAVAALYGLEVRAAGARFHPFENLSAHYLLLAQRVP